MDLSQLKWKLILAIIFGILLGTIVILASILLSTSGDECKFISSRPKPMKSDKNIASSDYTALASFSGYIKNGLGPNERYLPLKLLHVSYANIDQGQLILQTNCAQMTLQVYERADKSFYVNNIQVSMEKPVEKIEASSSLGSWRNCKVGYAGLYFGQYESYACDKRQELSCDTSDEQPAALVIDSIKFEINGEVDKIKRGEYSKPLRYCDVDLTLNSTI